MKTCLIQSLISLKLVSLNNFRTGFPGSQPVSMDISNIKFLAEKPYMVSWKADGTRYLMLIDGPEQIYFIDRDNCVFHSPKISFLFRDTGEHLSETLVDGVSNMNDINKI